MYTTRLLNISRRDRAGLAALVLFLVVVSVAGGRPAERPAPTAAPVVVIIIATPTVRPAGATGLMKEAAPMGAQRIVLAAPTVAPTTAPPLVEPIAGAVPTAAPAVAPAAEPTAPARWTIK